MKWEKAPEELVQFLAEKIKPFKCEYRKMFGYPAYFVNGNMFAGIHGNKLFIRLADSDVKKIMEANPEVKFFEPMLGRAMKGYVVLPKSLYADDAEFAKWLEQSVKYANSLPPKQKKK